MALLRVGGLNPGKRRDELLSNYDGEEPYMPGGYDTPYDGEEPYMPHDYASDYDDDEGYDDDGYDDGYRGDDDGYDDGYRRGRSRYDDDYGYDDDDYDEDGDYDRQPYYDAPNYGPERDNPPDGLMRFLDENDWPTWVLLVLLPPVGIWLLWRRRRYSDVVNIVLSVLSAIWFVAVIYVLVARPFRRASDTTITPQPVGVGAAPTQSPEPVEEAPAEEAVAEVVPTEEVDELNAVYTVEGGPYYHQTQDCVAIGEGVEPARVSRNSAIEASLMACPYCMGGQYSDGAFDLVFVNADTEDKSNIRVWCSVYNSFFHVKEDCSDMGGSAFEVSLKDALLMAKTACQTCCPRAGIDVFCTVDGTYYHINDECSGMRNASHVTYAEARVTGKKRCPVCIGGEDETEALPETEGDAAAAEQPSGYYVYATPNGTYYHVNSTCSGMQNAQQVLLSDMLKENRPACPKCCPNAESTVFAEKGNPYYHSYATCSGMTHATQGILVNALVAGLTRCPECWTADGQAAVSDGP